MADNIVKRIIDARSEFMIAHRQVPNRIKLPHADAAELCSWLNDLEDDPLLGHTPFGKRIMGMMFEESSEVQTITCLYEPELTKL